MKRILFVITLLLMQSVAFAQEGGFPLDHVKIDLSNHASLQRGAKLFVNYCMGCHSAKFMRYKRFADFAGIPEKLVQKDLIFTRDTKPGNHMNNAMPNKEAAKWFGAPPPDLTLMAQARGVDYLYTYLRSFYIDKTRPWGTNNAVFPKVGMPDVLWQMQGLQKPVYETVKDADGAEQKVIKGFQQVQPGTLTPREFDRSVTDLVNFMAYISEPIKQEREHLGGWVLLYLVLAFVVFYLLKREYWKDVPH